MADLVSKYFQEDLTEAEDEALSETLLNSPADSLRFAELALAAYQRYGLPEPRLPEGPKGPPPSGSGGIPWSWFWVLLGSASLVFWGYEAKWLDFGMIFAKAAATSSAAPTPNPKNTKPAGARKNPARTADSGPGRHSTTVALPSKNPTKQMVSPIISAKSLTPVLTPVDITTQPHRPHSDLAVIVHWPAPKEIRVRVLNAKGEEMVLLYQGLLPKGTWVFDWNGKQADGRFPSAGRYQILVESGTRVQKKNIVIKAHDPGLK